jgi:hypothetical protein
MTAETINMRADAERKCRLEVAAELSHESLTAALARHRHTVRVPADPRYISVLYSPDTHDVSSFTCGEADLETWLRDSAAPAWLSLGGESARP